MTEKSGFPRVHHTPSQQQNFSSDLKAEKARAREEDLSELLMVKEEEVCVGVRVTSQKIFFSGCDGHGSC